MIYCSNFYKGNGVIHILFPKPKSFASKETRDVSKWTINIPANTGSNGVTNLLTFKCVLLIFSLERENNILEF